METVTTANGNYGLAELNLEKTFGGMGGTKERHIPRIDLSRFVARKAEIADQLWSAASEIGFFQLVNHGIPTARSLGLTYRTKPSLDGAVPGPLDYWFE